MSNFRKASLSKASLSKASLFKASLLKASLLTTITTMCSRQASQGRPLARFDGDKQRSVEVLAQ